MFSGFYGVVYVDVFYLVVNVFGFYLRLMLMCFTRWEFCSEVYGG